ncbi:MAG: diguanylate cyclase, partial [Gammaproteobacteria bacterium]|nr:diguanylate cyclase [Gammaproteobacteria bacterium]
RGEVLGSVMVFHDVRHARQLHHKLSYQASHDSLTGLINRRAFEERLTDALEEISDDETRAYVLLYMDLDQFKVVNDTCGHTAGDLLLRQ